jgi:hypothetical protein
MNEGVLQRTKPAASSNAATLACMSSARPAERFGSEKPTGLVIARIVRVVIMATTAHSTGPRNPTPDRKPIDG